MKHLKKGRKFGREKKQREALLKNLLGELMLRGKISTTEAKAKELRIVAEKSLSRIKRSFAKAKKSSPSALRMIKQKLPRDVSVGRIGELAAILAQKNSGFTRITKTGSRLSDGAKKAVIEIG